jgi:hypothetical protein
MIAGLRIMKEQKRGLTFNRSFCDTIFIQDEDMPWVTICEFSLEEPSDGLSMYDSASEHLGLLQQATVAASSSHTPHRGSRPSFSELPTCLTRDPSSVLLGLRMF